MKVFTNSLYLGYLMRKASSDLREACLEYVKFNNKARCAPFIPERKVVDHPGVITRFTDSHQHPEIGSF